MHPAFDDHPGELDNDLLTWLASLDKDELAGILARRADVLEPPWPRRLDDLTRRLNSQLSTVLALREVPLPGLQVLRAVQLCSALDDDTPPDVATVSAQLGVAEPEVTTALLTLREFALAWVDESERVRVPEAMRGNGYLLYRLGLPVRESLSVATVDQLKRMATALGLAITGRKRDLVARVVAFFRDPDNIRSLVDDAPEEARELLLDAAWHGPDVGYDVGYLYYVSRYARGRHESPVEWAVNHGLICPDPEGTGYLPLEVCLALRGPAYRLPFTPDPPPLTTVRVTPDSVAAECSSAALRMIDRTRTVVAAAATEPIPLLKSGRVGVRAAKAIAKRTGAPVEEIRLVVELAITAGLLTSAEPPPADEPMSRGRKGRGRSRRQAPPPQPEGLVPTDEFTRWRDAASAARLRMLLGAWWALQQAPLAEEKAIQSVLGSEPSEAFEDVRQRTVRLLADQGEDVGVTAGLAERVRWNAPMLTEELVGPLVDAALAEAELLGVIASGAAGELGRALVASSGMVDDPALVKATDTLVADARGTALFGSDLTAVVTGPADAELAGLLDRVAFRESQGVASTWRFSPDSVRRAFDNGASADDLFDQLTSIAEGTLPQPLEYLINDVARRHGELGVLDVRCVVVGENPTLVTEIVAERKLTELGLRQVAPTVLTSGVPATETLAALRKAGYSPVAKDSDGSIVVSDEQFAPAPPRVSQATELVASFDGHLLRLREPEEAPEISLPDPAEHAARLLRESGTTVRPLARGDLTGALYREHGDRLSPEWMQFAWTLEAGMPVRVDYREPDGETRRIRISRPELDGDTIDVWCSEDRDYRQLELTRIAPLSIR
jgi:hypothetical protein